MKVLNIIKYLFTILGVCLLVGTFFSYKNVQNFNNTALSSQGIVVEIVSSRTNDSFSYYPVVEFTAEDGETIVFQSSTGSNPPSYSMGETVEVLYQASTPSEARINSKASMWGGVVVLGVLGAMFLCFGILFMVLGGNKSRLGRRLKEHGVPIQTVVHGVEQNGILEVNGQYPYQILTHWTNPSTAESFIFKSENIWFDPTEYIERDEITVFIEENNPKKYYVDISFLPKVLS